MLPQLTVYAKILYLLMVVIAGALCNMNHVYLYSKCTSLFVGLTADGKLSANNTVYERQIVTISNHVPQGVLTEQIRPFNLTLFLEKAQMYVCFTKKWRLVTSKKLQESCYFYETMENGWFQYRSAIDESKHIGFTKRGRPVRYGKRVHSVLDTQCFNIYKMDPQDIINNSPAVIKALQLQRHFPPLRHHSNYAPISHYSDQNPEQQFLSPIPTKRKIIEPQSNKLHHTKHVVRKKPFNNSRRILTAYNTEQRGTVEKKSRIKGLERVLDYSNDDFGIIRTTGSEYSNITKKPLASKKVTSINSGIGPKLRHHGKNNNHRKKPS